MTSGSSRRARPAWDAAAAKAWADALAADLHHPPATGGIFELAEAWRVERVRAVCRRPADFADYPELSVRIRGAFGRALAALPPPASIGWSRPPAVAILFGSAGRWASGLEIPKPCVVRAWVDHDRLVAEVALHGAAGIYAREASEALANSLRAGIAVGPDMALRIPLTVLDVAVTRTDGLSAPAHAVSASLCFRTPVAVRDGGRLRPEPAAILRAALTRASGMARWHGLRLDENWKHLHRTIDALAIDDSGLVPAAWRRHSARQQGNAIPMAGWLGPLRLAGRLDRLAPFLAVTGTCNIGSHASLGLGWFDVAIA